MKSGRALRVIAPPPPDPVTQEKIEHARKAYFEQLRNLHLADERNRGIHTLFGLQAAHVAGVVDATVKQESRRMLQEMEQLTRINDMLLRQMIPSHRKTTALDWEQGEHAIFGPCRIACSIASDLSRGTRDYRSFADQLDAFYRCGEQGRQWVHGNTLNAHGHHVGEALYAYTGHSQAWERHTVGMLGALAKKDIATYYNCARALLECGRAIGSTLKKTR